MKNKANYISQAILFIILLIIGILCFECSSKHSKEEHSSWAYKGENSPEHWAELDKDYLPCNEGKTQSPINIAHETKTGKHTLKFEYKTSHEDIVNNGHTIQFKYDEGSKIHFDNKVYELVQFHFHTPSEHQIDGKSFPAEVHFVHKDSTNHLLVISLFIEEGKSNEFLKNVINDIPDRQSEQEYNKAININRLIPQDQHFFYYKGSLTTPPCTEGVKWLVFKKHIFADSVQINHLKEIEGFNARPTQKKHNREIEEI